MSNATEATCRDAVLPEADRYPFPPRQDGGWFRLEIPARIDAVGPLCAFLTLLAERRGLSPDEIHRVEIAAYETCLNIIEHAYHFDGSARITVRARMDRERAVLSFTDHGEGVDPERIPPPDINDPLIRLRGRGFGIQIIRRSMDLVRYRRTPRGENNLLLIKYFDRDRPRRNGPGGRLGGDVA
ncbi:MAG: ATP-binding protein [Candidatus Eisenbacteria bacterium]|nr:ATP-binding protein [Candidatus Eisenbacteria bacterium]